MKKLDLSLKAHGFGATDSQFRAAIADGLTASQIANRFVISEGAVRTRARYLGLTIAKVERKPEWHAKAIELHAAGLRNYEIAAQCRVSKGAVSSCLSSNGLDCNRKMPTLPTGGNRGSRPRAEKTAPRYGAPLPDGPIVDRVYRVIEGAQINSNVAIGGAIVLETTDPIQAFRATAQRPNRVKVDANNKVLAYSRKR